MITLGATHPAHTFTCSRAQCENSAEWAIHWRNPKIHSADRQKTWLACESHVNYLRDFLEARSFPLEVVPTTALESAQ